MKGKIGKSIGKTIIKSIKKFGIRSDDITDMISEFDIDGIIATELNNIKENENDNIVLLGYYDGKVFKFKAVNLEDNGENRSYIGNSRSFKFFGAEKEHFTITELINSLINLTFSAFDKKKDKKEK